MKSKMPKAKPPQIVLDVAPQNGAVKRLVIARLGDAEFADKIDPFNATSREKFVDKLAAEFKRPVEQFEHVKASLVTVAKDADARAKKAAEDEEANASSIDAPMPSALQTEAILAETPADIVEEAEAMLKSPNLFDILGENLALLGVIGEHLLARTIYLIATSRKLQQPLSGCIMSASSTGKSFVTTTVVGCMPAEDVIVATDLSPMALYYLPYGALTHKLVTVAERRHASGGDYGDEANSTLALREMLSAGELHKAVALSGPDGRPATEIIHQPGPIGYIETTTRAEIFSEDASRMVSLTTDETAEHTAAIMTHQAIEAASTDGDEQKKARIKLVHQTAQRMLRKLRVRVPYAGKLMLPSAKVIARRLFPQFLACIRSVALLRQLQKIENGGWIDADADDYQVAYEVMVPILARTFAPLSDRAAELLGAIRSHRKLEDPQEFTRADCRAWSGVGATEVANRLDQLLESSHVEAVAGGPGKKYVYRLAYVQPKLGAISLAELITPEQLRAELDQEADEDGDPPVSSDKFDNEEFDNGDEPDDDEADDEEFGDEDFDDGTRKKQYGAPSPGK